MGDFKTLSIDIGSTFGYCVGVNGVIVESGEVTLTAGAAGKTHPGHRWMRFQRWLANYHDVNEVLFEDVQFVTSPQQMKVYGALLSQLELFSLGHGIRMCSLTPGQIKKDFTGMGNSKKDVLCDVAMRLGWRNGVPGTMNNHNEADAIALYWVVCSRRGLQPRFLAAQQDELDNDKLEVVT
jgi:Holliday junction resolvasome RuvABC endonuclease subunit